MIFRGAKEACFNCGGRGYKIDGNLPCSVCGGKGVVRKGG
jgi:DnaJ-class molecular chaperone